jgi:ABC-type thiamin/hydroxymethylpyrimidine transport system permease subunit
LIGGRESEGMVIRKESENWRIKAVEDPVDQVLCRTLASIVYEMVAPGRICIEKGHDLIFILTELFWKLC